MDAAGSSDAVAATIEEMSSENENSEMEKMARTIEQLIDSDSDYEIPAKRIAKGFVSC